MADRRISKMTSISKVTLISAFALIAFSACGGNSGAGDSKGGGSGGTSKTFRQTSGSYRFKIDSCDTERKTYASEAELCDLLRDHAANHFCAEDLRRKMFEQSCQGSFDEGNRTVTPPTDVTSPVTPSQPTKKQSTVIEEVILEAHPKERFEVKPIMGDNILFTMLNGEAEIDSVTGLDEASSLQLTTAGSISIVDPDLQTCNLSIRNFKNLGSDKTLAFTLGGSDPLEDAAKICASSLMSMQLNGLTVHFFDVRVGQLSDKTVKKVILNIKPQ